MFKGKLYGSGSRCAPALLLLACTLPALSNTEQPGAKAVEPSAAQRLLIEVHGNTGVGWWSSATARGIAEPEG